VLHYTAFALHCIEMDCAELHRTALHCVALRSIALHRAALRCNCDASLHYTLQHYASAAPANTAVDTVASIALSLRPLLLSLLLAAATAAASDLKKSNTWTTHDHTQSNAPPPLTLPVVTVANRATSSRTAASMSRSITVRIAAVHGNGIIWSIVVTFLDS
jgi:hypothetical protein